MAANTPEQDPGFTTIRPVDVGPVGAAPSPATPGAAPDAPAGISVRTVVIATLLLVVGGLALMSGLQWLNRPSPPIAAADQATPTESAPAEAVAPVPTQAPWDDTDALKARARAQDLANAIAERIDDLETKAVTQWGAAPFAAARKTVQQAELQMRERQFAAAAKRYEVADEALAALQAQVPEVLRDAVNQADAALQVGDAEAAQRAITRATAIAAEDDTVQSLTARLATLPAVLALLTAADAAERAGDLAAAEKAFADAVAEDAEMRRAKEGLLRVSGVRAAARFQRVMGEALSALDAGRFDAAETALSRAAAIRPNDSAVRAAQARLADARREQRITGLMEQARAAVAAENWALAVQHYQAVLALDANRGNAQDGLATARPRADLSARLAGLISQPQRLSSPAVQTEAEQQLAAARAVANAGPQLRGQINQLDSLLRASRTPVAVRLTSDGHTEVTVYRVGEQGRFTDKALQLLPGRYIAVGVRRGYRDVRVEFDVLPGQPVTVAVRAEEAL